MDDYTKSVEKYLQNEEFRQEWERTELEFQIQDMLIKARNETNLTQAELAAISGVRQSNISRIESGSVIPSLVTLMKLAKAMGKTLKVSMP